MLSPLWRHHVKLPSGRFSPGPKDAELKRWAMVLLESVGVGVMSVILVLGLVLVAVGIYVQLIWPLTGWDLVTVKLEHYKSTVSAFLTAIFVFGFCAGFWFISRAAWKRMKRPRPIFAQKVVARSRRQALCPPFSWILPAAPRSLIRIGRFSGEVWAVMMDDAKRWEGRLVNGRFPLRQYLGGSEHSAVFLTERGQGQSAAIKLIPFDSATADPQLARWKQAAELSHPHLLRIFETGRCRIDNAGFLFVVMEYAEEDLSQILPQRALTPGEAQQMLGPVVEALRYLHGRGWVHGRLRPSNIQASGDQVKLSSDRMGKVGEGRSGTDRASAYDPPETGKGGNSAAGDVWALGVTLTESLTRQLPRANGNDRGEVRLPEGLTSPFLDIARNCLWRDPRQRWALTEIAAQLGPTSAGAEKAAAGAAPKEQPAVAAAEELPRCSGAPEEPTSRSRWLWAVVVAAVIAGGVYLVRHRPQGEATSPSAVIKKPAPSMPPGTPSPSSAGALRTAADEIVAREVPAIPKSARETIQGRVKVRVRVNVDSSGNVVRSKFDLHGPSDYFARQAQQAAMRWKFSPSPEAERQWVLLFEFTRGGTQVFPSGVQGKH